MDAGGRLRSRWEIHQKIALLLVPLVLDYDLGSHLDPLSRLPAAAGVPLPDPTLLHIGCYLG